MPLSSRWRSRELWWTQPKPSHDATLRCIAVRQVEAYKRSSTGWGPGTVAVSKPLAEALKLILMPIKPWLDSGGATRNGDGAMMKLLPLAASHAVQRRQRDYHNQDLEIDMAGRGYDPSVHRSSGHSCVVYHEIVVRLLF